MLYITSPRINSIFRFSVFFPLRRTDKMAQNFATNPLNFSKRILLKDLLYLLYLGHCMLFIIS